MRRAPESEPKAAIDLTDERILDAAYASVMAIGVRRTRLTDVAERAGLSRMTVYRRYPDVTSVLQALMLREFAGILNQAGFDAAAGANGRERVIDSSVHGLQLISAHELFLRLLDVDPELLLPYMTSRPGRFQLAAADALAAGLEAGMDDGSVRRDDAKRLAGSMLLAMRGFAFEARVKRTRKQRQSMLEDMRLMLDGLLRAGAA